MSPYAITWSSPNSGNHTVTAIAQNNSGVTGNSNAITVKISKALRGVRNGKGRAGNLSDKISDSDSFKNATSNSTAATTAELDDLVALLEQTSIDFYAEREMFASTPQIENYLFAAYFLSRSSAALSRESTPFSGAADRLEKVEAYLSFCDDLMVAGSISQSTLNAARRANVLPDLPIGRPSTVSLDGSSLLIPGGVGRITSNSPSTPLTSRTAGTGSLTFQLAGVSVAINGRVALVVSVSPTEILFYVPEAESGGLGDIIVTAEDGRISHGTSTIQGLNPTIFSLLGFTPSVGAALNGISFVSELTASTQFIGFDSRTRISILGTGISSGLQNTDTRNDVRLPGGQVIPNLAEWVTIEVRTSDGRVMYLPVEFAGPDQAVPGLDQINAVLLPELQGAGRVELTPIVGGQRGNTSAVNIR